ncbi:MAG TPA: hypothetical protein PLU63_02860 [Candidatus Woesebacteria bacterium]|nr:hypothetical protein [Candidatus Woesebacteria bacterium]
MKKFGILSILFLLFSLIGVLYLVKNNQDIRNKAAPGDYNGGSLCNGYINNYCSQYGVTATLSKCPNQWESSCWNSQTIKGTSLCMDKNFCGSQQLDVYYNDGGSCWVDYWDYSCDAPTATPIPPTNTPIPTNTPTPTGTPKPTNTPTPTNTPKPTATGTPKPTNTPTPTNTPKPTATGTPEPTATNTPIPPTNTPIPTQVITEGPSPTRIILPESGVEFPSQILTLVGGIITLLGFLILL